LDGVMRAADLNHDGVIEVSFTLFLGREGKFVDR
jgi:hypothetical protein